MPDPAATLTLEADIAIWGASLWGDSDPGVLAAEEWVAIGPNGQERLPNEWHRGPLWDHQGRRDVLVTDDTGAHAPPLWWSLPWLTRHVLRAA